MIQFGGMIETGFKINRKEKSLCQIKHQIIINE